MAMNVAYEVRSNRYIMTRVANIPDHVCPISVKDAVISFLKELFPFYMETDLLRLIAETSRSVIVIDSPHKNNIEGEPDPTVWDGYCEERSRR